MSDASAVKLDGLTIESEVADRAVGGFDHRHSAEATQIVSIAQAFQTAGYVLEMLTCEDRREDLEKMRLVYTFNQLAEVDRHLVVVELKGEIPGAMGPSITDVYPAADWYEREVYDMYGVSFSGHPNLKRILLPDDSDFHALLKDFGRMEDAPADAPTDA